MDWSKLSEIPVIAVILFLSVLFGALATISEKGREFYRFLWRVTKKVWGYIIVPKRISDIEKKYKAIDEKLDILIGEVRVNGGNSLKDVVDSIALRIFIESEFRRKLMDDVAFWESDKNGNCVYASDKLGEVIGLPPNDILGNGWITNVKDEDKSRVFKEWTYAVEQKRRFIQNYTFIHNDGTEIKVQGQSEPIIHNGKIEGFVGILTVRN